MTDIAPLVAELRELLAEDETARDEGQKRGVMPAYHGRSVTAEARLLRGVRAALPTLLDALTNSAGLITGVPEHPLSSGRLATAGGDHAPRPASRDGSGTDEEVERVARSFLAASLEKGQQPHLAQSIRDGTHLDEFGLMDWRIWMPALKEACRCLASNRASSVGWMKRAIAIDKSRAALSARSGEVEREQFKDRVARRLGFEEGLEASAKVAEKEPEWEERVTPAHDEKDDWGEILCHVPEKVTRIKRYPLGKSIAAAIRAIKPGE